MMKMLTWPFTGMIGIAYSVESTLLFPLIFYGKVNNFFKEFYFDAAGFSGGMSEKFISSITPSIYR